MPGRRTVELRQTVSEWARVSEQFEPTGSTSRADIHWVYLATLYFLLSGAAFYLYLARVLPPDELGAVVILQAITTVVAATLALGLGSGFQHFLSYYKGRREPERLRILLKGSLTAAALLALVGFAITFALSGSLAALLFRSPDYQPAIELVGLYAGLSTAMAVLQGTVLGLQRFALYAARSIVAYTTSYGAAIVFLHLWPGVRSIVAGWVLGASVGCVLYVAAVVGERAPSDGTAPLPPASALPSTPLYRSVLLYSLPVLVSSVITSSATYIDRLVLAGISSLSSVGFYNYALLFVMGSQVVTAPFGTILLPKLSEHLGRDDRPAIRAITRTSVTLVVLIYVPFALAIAALGPFLLGLLVGPSFVRDSFPMAVLLLFTAASIPGGILGSLAAGIRRTPALMQAAALALAANAGLSVLLIPRIGILGAALGNSAMYWGPLLVLFLALRGTGLIEVDLASIARIWGAAIAMALVVALPLLLWGYRLPLVLGAAALGLAVLLVTLRLLRAIPSDATEYLLHVIPRRLGLLQPAVCWVAACDGCQHRPEPVGAVAK